MTTILTEGDDLAVALYFITMFPEGSNVSPLAVWHNASNKQYWRARAIYLKTTVVAIKMLSKVEA